MKNLAKKADSFATRIAEGNRRPLTWDGLRDLIDLWTGSVLDYKPLDILTDMTAQRVVAAGVIVDGERSE
jgi:hypothetical protein